VETERTVNAPANKAESLPLEYRGNRKLYELYNGDRVLKYKYVLDDEGVAFWLDSDKQIYATVIYAATVAAKPETAAAGKINFEIIYFNFDSSMPKNEDITLLDKTVQIITDNESMSVIIEGHTDAIGTDDYNQKLSERRANAVYNYFLNKGIPASRMKKIGYGLQKPVAENKTPDGQDNPEGRAKNRRVQLRSDTLQP
jgi:outer membrane protein OmpA-like peptidoglycan-associated protein